MESGRKVNQIRIYSGEKYEAVNECEAGEICAVTGLNKQDLERAGFGASPLPLIEPVMTYQILLPDGMNPRAILPKLQELEEENPELSIVWSEVLREIRKGDGAGSDRNFAKPYPITLWC